jgi:hypothetical protein
MGPTMYPIYIQEAFMEWVIDFVYDKQTKFPI